MYVAVLAHLQRYEGPLPKPIETIRQEFLKRSELICKFLQGTALQQRPPFIKDQKGAVHRLNYNPVFALKNAIEFQTRVSLLIALSCGLSCPALSLSCSPWKCLRDVRADRSTPVAESVIAPANS